MDRSRVGVVIPALNEEATIEKVVVGTLDHGLPIVVSDGSTDATAELAAKAGAVVVCHSSNRGYDAALNSGFKKAFDLGCEIIVTLDADGQHDTSLLQRFIMAVDGGADVVVGVRNQLPRFAERIFALYTKMRFGIHDPLCGMKAYRKHVYASLGYFDSYSSVGTELALFAAKKEFIIKQIPFVVRDRDGKPRFGNLLRSNLRITRSMVRSLLSQ